MLSAMGTTQAVGFMTKSLAFTLAVSRIKLTNSGMRADSRDSFIAGSPRPVIELQRA